VEDELIDVVEVDQLIQDRQIEDQKVEKDDYI
jgi:hypothetical protein